MGDDKTQSREMKYALENGDDDFRTYAVQWNASYIEWTLDDKQTFHKNLTELLSSYKVSHNPFSKNFHLAMTVTVGGGSFNDPSQDVMENDTLNWECPMLIMDHVRIYQWIENGSDISNDALNDTARS